MDYHFTPEDIRAFARANLNMRTPLYDSFAADAFGAKYHCVDPRVHPNHQWLEFSPLDQDGNLTMEGDVTIRLSDEVRAYCDAEAKVPEGQLTAMRALNILRDIQGDTGSPQPTQNVC